MKALILLGGLGSRLRPFTLEKPKPLLPVLNRPFFSYQLKQLKKFGVREVVLALGYRAAHFRSHLGSGGQWNMRFIYSLEKTPLGTGGAIRNSIRWLDGPTFILNGDILCDIDLAELARWHRGRKAGGTLALAWVENPASFGLIETDGRGRIRRFIEKPSPSEATAHTINAGYYLFQPEVIRRIPPGRPVSIEREVFPELVKEGFPLYGYHHRGYWSDIGTLQSYWNTHRDLMRNPLMSGKVRRVRPGLWAEPGCRLPRSLKVRGRVLLGAGCSIGDGTVFEGTVCIGSRGVIGDGAYLSDCVLHEGTTIGAQARIEGALVGARCRVGDFCRVGPNQVLANGTVLPAYSQQVPGLTRSSDPEGLVR